MSIKLGTLSLVDLRLGTNTIGKVFLGTQLIAERPFSEEWQKVVARMSSPTQSFEDAIKIYVEAEQAALEDNWSLTDDLQVFMVDTSTNSLISWKGIANPTIHSGAPTFTAYDGYLLKSSTSDAINTNLDNTKFSNYTLNSAFVGVNFVSATSGVIQKIMSSLNSALGFTIASGGSLESNVNITTPLLTAHGGKYDGYYVGHVVENTKYNLLEDGEIIDTTTTARNILPTNINIGMATDSEYFDGKNRFNVWGGGAGFDPVAHSVNVKNYVDAMLIEKHRTVVDTVLNRYTNLSTIETLTISRLVARSEENGYWSTRDEVFLLGLFDEANALTGMKLKTATITGSPEWTSGVGYYISGEFDVINTNLNPSVDTVSQSLGNVSIGLNFTDYVYVYFNRLIWASFGDISSIIYAINLTTLNLRVQAECCPANVTHTITGGNYNIIRTSINQVDLNVNGSHILTNIDIADGLVNDNYFIGNSEAGGQPINAKVKTFYTGTAIDLDLYKWNTDLHQTANELEIEKANDNNDWNIINETYDWSNRELAPDQLEKLVGIIDLNSDGTTTGRSLDITANLGITLNAQLSLDSLVAKGWVII